MANEDKDTLVAFGGQIKALGDRKIGGFLVNYGSADDVDLEGEFFTKDTDFGINKTLPVHYDHGYNEAFGKKSLGTATIKEMDAGLWFEAELSKAGEFEDMIISLAEQGKLRSSSGAVGHLVDRVSVGEGKSHITAWPLGEASLTTRPAGGMATAVMPIKQFKELADAEKARSEDSPVKESEPLKADANVTVNLVVNGSPIEADTTLKSTPNKEHTMPDTQETNGPLADDGMKSILERLEARLDASEAKNVELEKAATIKAEIETKTAPTVIMNRRPDTQSEAFAHWMKTGDVGGVKSLITDNDMGRDVVSIKASNATDMNVGTAADGGNVVTDDMWNNIIRKRDESGLMERLGVTQFTGTGTTLDVPLDNEADSEFVSTNEAAQFDNDAPAIGTLALTKVKYSKRTLISYELLQDSHNTADLMSYITDRVGIGYAKTLNDLIITEVETNGTEFEVMPQTTVAVDELEGIALRNANAYYVENPADANWVMAPATYQAIQILDDTSIRRYTTNVQGQGGATREILGSQVHFSNKCEAIGSGLKSILFGNFSYVAMYLDPSLQFMLDPYTRADYGQNRLLWYFRADAGTTQSDAIGYGRHIST